jgi:hypothetical protein
VRDPASFRDPAGRVYRRGGVLLRQVNRSFAGQWDQFLASGLYPDLVSSGLLVSHEEADSSLALDDEAYLVIRPREVPFVSYPYEWSFSQLKDAALATLAIQERALAHGMSLRDASAYNIQFVDGRPLLIDTLSFEPVRPGAPWPAYRQFCQHFLAPLALMAYRDPRVALLLRDFIDGVPLDLASALLPTRTRLRPGLAMHVHAHARAQRRSRTADDSAVRARVSESGRLALLDSLRRTVEGLRWTPSDTPWASYTTETSYSPAAAASKTQHVRAFLDRARRGVVWDVGANTGTFSAIAADAGRPVVAMDADPGAVERMYLLVRSGRSPGVTPLVVDVTNPSPGIGWLARERRSLLERGPADVVLALALVHHLAIGSNVPLPDISTFFAAIAHELIVEFVPKVDPQVAAMLRSREDVFPGYTITGLRDAFASDFRLVEEQQIEDSLRVLFRMERRAP